MQVETSRESRGGREHVTTSASEAVDGFEFSTLSLGETIATMRAWVAEGDAGAPRLFACGNPHSLEVARRDAGFAAALRGADLLVPDGVGIVVGSWIQGGRIRKTVCGPDVFAGLSRELNERVPGARVFFLGGTESTLAAIAEKYGAEFPRLVVAGTYAPPFRSKFSREDEQDLIDRVNAASPDLLWIGLGAPKQEKLAFANRNRLRVRMIGPVGAVFDFYTGRVKLPPRWVQKLGLIWLFRFLQQPRRLWERQVNGAVFLMRMATRRVLGKRA
ncbi:WecB/TagA/CpsF family glycosyltransferase [Opitutales bacterium ASA1]|nr:WecB/TagA/CpsF family glycosyltransferase [Opitutales bacterium ASA1]